MVDIKRSQIVRLFSQIALGAIPIALVTFVCFRARLNFPIPSFLYLLLVVLQSLWAGFGSSAIVSIIAAACLEYFFIPPVLEWQINDPEYGVALLTYWLTSLVITRLASKARDEAQLAERRRRDAGLLYEVASRLLSLAPEVAADVESLRIFREVLGLRAVCLFDAGFAKLQIQGESAHGLPEKTYSAFACGACYPDGDSDCYIRCLYTGGRLTGAVGFEGRLEEAAIALPLSVLAATALERMRAFRTASKASADAQAEMMRSAILDAFAHEFKTPLAIILAAAGGIQEVSSGNDAQSEMAEIIENQTMRLSQLTTRLLRIAKLDREEVTPRIEQISFPVLLRGLVDQSQRRFGRRVLAQYGSAPVEIEAAPELLSLAVNQLLDNACKYSPEDSVVSVGLCVKGESANLHVTNEGISIRPEEAERIFERFFRSSETEKMAPGDGLGLYVAKKIVHAHGGILELDQNSGTLSSTTFRICMPIRRLTQIV